MDNLLEALRILLQYEEENNPAYCNIQRIYCSNGKETTAFCIFNIDYYCLSNNDQEFLKNLSFTPLDDYIDHPKVIGSFKYVMKN